MHLRSRRIFVLSFLVGTLAAAQTIRITDNATDDGWAALRGRSASRGKVIWKAADGVRYFDGAAEQIVQPNGVLSSVDTVIGLGPGSSAGSVVGYWRRGTDQFWIWQEGGSPVEVSNVNPFFAARQINPETAAVGAGCVFVVYQTQNDAAQNFRHVFRTLFDGSKSSISGSSVKSYVEDLSASGCRAAWHFDPDIDVAGDDQILYWNGTSLTTLDSGPVGRSHFAGNRVVWVRVVSGAEEIFYSDVSGTPTAPQQLGTLGDPALSITALRTDGSHVAWLRSLSDGSDLRFIGTLGLRFGPPFMQRLELDGGVPLWQDGANIRAIAAGRIRTISTGTAATLGGGFPVAADGYVAHAGLDEDEGTDLEVYRTALQAGTTGTPQRPVVVPSSRGSSSASVSASEVFGASGYEVYRARGFGAARETFSALPGGTMTSLAVNGTSYNDLVPSSDYSFSMAAVNGGARSPATPAMWDWVFSPTFPSGFPAWAVATDPDNRLVVYASAHDATYKSTDGGWNWTQLLGGDIPSKRVRALAVGGGRVFAVTQDGLILRSTDGGAIWSTVASGTDLGEIIKSVAIDPRRPDVIYAGDLQLASYDFPADSYLVRSIDGGATWEHLPAPASGEIRAYDLAFDVDDSQILFTGGSGVPVLRSMDSGQNWTDVSPGSFTVEALAVDAITGELYAGGGVYDIGVGNLVGKLFRSDDRGASWSELGAGLPDPMPPVRDLLARGGVLYLATTAGVWMSEDGGGLWHPYRRGMELAPDWVEGRRLAFAGAGRLLATGSDGLRVIPLDRPLPPDGTDFGGDGLSELVWRNPSTGQNVIWTMETVARRSYGSTLSVPGSDWEVAATGDFNRDGRADLLWRNASLSKVVVWFMSGTTRLGYADLGISVPAPWVIGGAGDFDRDGDADIVWRNPTTGQNVLWFMEGTARVSYSTMLTLAAPWRIAGAGDFDADGDADLVWRNDSTGQTAVWLMKGATRVSYALLPVVSDLNWKVTGVGDFNGDGWCDLVWRNQASGANVIWFMEGLTRASYGGTTSVTGPWLIVGPR